MIKYNKDGNKEIQYGFNKDILMRLIELTDKTSKRWPLSTVKRIS